MKKWISFIIITLMALLLMLGCSKSNKFNDDRNNKIVQPTDPAKEDANPPAQNTPAPSSVSDPIKDQINGMTLDEKIGQMVMSGVDGYTISETTVKMIRNYHVGGFIILGENINDANQLLNLVNSLKTTNSSNTIPLLLSIDQEGGRIDRMPAEFKRLPSNKAIDRR